MKAWIDKLLRRQTQPAHLKTGRWGEDLAAKMLKSRKYRILGRRVRVGKRDEIDIVAAQDKVLVFVEVKTRANERYGRPADAVGAGKRKRLSRAAIAYLRSTRRQPAYIRFDIIEVLGHAEEGKPEIRHIENAFTLDPAYRLWW